jgi:hypothetical protein
MNNVEPENATGAETESEAPKPTKREEELLDVAKEAKGSFGLIESIKNRPMRTAKLDLGFDEINSEKLAGIEAALGQLRNILDKAERNIAAGKEYARIALALEEEIEAAEEGTDLDIDSLRADQADAEAEAAQRAKLGDDIKPVLAKAQELEEAAETVREQVRGQSLSVELRAIPYKLARGSARRARAALEITQKGIPAEKQDEFEERQLLELAYDQVARWRNNSTGEQGGKLDMEVIETMRDFLPISQSSKFFTMVNELQFKNAISESAIAQADF